MKIIFLDVDGVLNSPVDWIEQRVFGHPHNKGTEQLNRGKLALLFTLIGATDAKVVFSSTWRLHFSLDKLVNMFNERAGKDSKNKFSRDWFLGMTLDLGGYDARSREIQLWLSNHKEKLGISHYVIIDDVDAGFSRNGMSDNFVKTNPLVGMTSSDAYFACEVLEGRTNEMPRIFL